MADAEPDTSNVAAQSDEPADATAVLAIPGTPAGVALRWVLLHLSPVAPQLNAQDLPTHFTTTFLDAIGADVVPGLFASLRGQLGAVSLRQLEVDRPHTVVAVLETALGIPVRLTLHVDVDDPTRIGGLLIQPAADTTMSTPTTWQAWGEQVRGLAPQAAWLAAEVTSGACTSIDAHDADALLPLGSTFKLWVLLALAQEVRAGALDWQQPLALDARWYSLPSGTMQDEAPGTLFPLQEFAQRMIAISDNTATDHLVALLGRERVEAAIASAGHQEIARTLPLLTTGDLFRLRLSPEHSARYAVADVATRRQMLVELGELPLPALTGIWPAPRDTATIEWFASANDLCRLWSSLLEEIEADQSGTVAQIVAANPGVATGDEWSWVGYKGGSEPGVLSVTWALQRPDGRTYVLLAGLHNPTHPFVEISAVHVIARGLSLFPH